MGIHSTHFKEGRASKPVSVCEADSLIFVVPWVLRNTSLKVCTLYRYVHYRSNVWGHLEMSLFKEKHSLFFNEDNVKLIRNTV